MKSLTLTKIIFSISLLIFPLSLHNKQHINNSRDFLKKVNENDAKVDQKINNYLNIELINFLGSLNANNYFNDKTFDNNNHAQVKKWNDFIFFLSAKLFLHFKNMDTIVDKDFSNFLALDLTGYNAKKAVNTYFQTTIETLSLIANYYLKSESQQIFITNVKPENAQVSMSLCALILNNKYTDYDYQKEKNLIIFNFDKNIIYSLKCIHTFYLKIWGANSGFLGDIAKSEYFDSNFGYLFINIFNSYLDDKKEYANFTLNKIEWFFNNLSIVNKLLLANSNNNLEAKIESNIYQKFFQEYDVTSKSFINWTLHFWKNSQFVYANEMVNALIFSNDIIDEIPYLNLTYSTSVNLIDSNNVNNNFMNFLAKKLKKDYAWKQSEELKESYDNYLANLLKINLNLLNTLLSNESFLQHHQDLKVQILAYKDALMHPEKIHDYHDVLMHFESTQKMQKVIALTFGQKKSQKFIVMILSIQFGILLIFIILGMIYYKIKKNHKMVN